MERSEQEPPLSLPDAVPLDDDAQAFATRWMDAERAGVALRFFAGSAAAHAGALALAPAAVSDASRPWLAAAHGALLALAVAGIAVRRRAPWRAAFAVLGLALAVASYLALVAIQSDAVLPGAVATALTVLGLLNAPLPGPLLLGAVVGLGACATVALHAAAGGHALAALYMLVTAAAAGARFALDHRARREALREHALRAHVAPPRVVRAAPASGCDVRAAFRPAQRHCVCVSSDWRSPRPLSAPLAPTPSPSQLAMSLGEYYELCHRLLRRHAPEGNYYADWLSSELLVVFYDGDGEGDPAARQRLLSAAVGFAQALLAARAEFARLHGAPLALDVGIACGDALVGIMGSGAQSKAAALGPVPERARRLQGVGKLLRRRHGDADRVILDQAARAALGDEVPLRTYTFAAGESVRDMPDREVYYAEAQPQPAPKERRA